MKQITKENTRTVVDKTTVWVAIDGSEFTNEIECCNYEKSAKCVINNKLKNCLISKNTEEDVFGAGSEEYELIVYYPTSQEEKDTLLQMYYLEHLRTENPWNIDKLTEDLKKENVHYMFGRDCDDSVYYISTVEDRLNIINKLLLNKE